MKAQPEVAFLEVPQGLEDDIERAHQIAIYVNASELAIAACRQLADTAQAASIQVWQEHRQHSIRHPSPTHQSLAALNTRRVASHYDIDTRMYGGMLSSIGAIRQTRYLEALNDHHKGVDRGDRLRQQDLDYYHQALGLLISGIEPEASL